MIYLDHNATSPLLEPVRAAMEPWWGVPANPASAHHFGQRAAAAVERAREQVAALVGGSPAGVVFTSGSTEANQTWLLGARPATLALAAIEHPCVRTAAARLAAQGTALVALPVTAAGEVVLDELPPVDAVALMAANHESGVLQPVERALELAAARGFRVLVDATQAAGRVPLRLGGAAGIALSSHKLGGPAGVGALVLPDGRPFPPLLTGGSQERGRRAGTVNVAGVVGFGEACVLARDELAERAVRWSAQRDRVDAAVRGLGARIAGEGAERLPNTTCAVFPGLDGELLVQVLDLRGIAVSHGAACASGSLEPSPVLVAMGESDPRGALRISLGPRTTDEEVTALIEALRLVIPAVRA